MKSFSRAFTFCIAAIVGILLSTTAFSQVTLEFMGSFSAEHLERIETVLDAFYEETGITVHMNQVPVSNLPSKQSTMILADGRNDIMYASVLWSNVFAANGWLVDLTDRLDELDMADWIDGSWASGTYEGRVYAIPMRRDPFGIIYNKDMFEAAGIESCPETTDEFLEVAQRLTGNGVYGIGVAGADHPQSVTQLINYLYFFNNPMFNEELTETVIDSPSGVAALQFYSDLVNKYGVAQPTAATDNRFDVERLFYAGRVAMIVDGPWIPPIIEDQAPNLDWGVCVVPRPADGEHWALGSGWDVGIPINSPYPDEAWEFIKYIVDPSHAENMIKTFPARKSSLALPAFSTPFKEPWLESLLNMRAQPATPIFIDAMPLIQSAVNELVSGRSSATEVARELDTQIQTLLDEYDPR